MQGAPARILLVDDHQMVLHGLTAMLSQFPSEVEVVGTAGSAHEARRAAAELDPDVVLCDVRLGNASGLDLCADLLRANPAHRVVFLTVYDDEQYLYQALRAGAAGFLLKRVDGQELVRSLRQVIGGDTVIDPVLAGRVAVSAARIQTGEFWPGAHLGLTQRESEALSLLVAGLSNRAIARKLVVSEETVKSHLRSLYRKLSVADRSGAIAVALREGLFH